MPQLLAHRLDESRRPAGQGLAACQVGCPAVQVARLEMPLQAAIGPRPAGQAPAQLQVRVARRQRLQLAEPGALAGMTDVVQPQHGTAIAVLQRLAEQAEQGRQAAAGGQQADRLGLHRPAQIALRGLQLDTLADRQVFAQPGREQPVRVTLDGDFQALADHPGQAVAAPDPHPVALRQQLDVLARPRRRPAGGGTQGQGEHIVGHPVACLDPRIVAVQRRQRMGVAQQAVDIGLTQPPTGGETAQGCEQRGQEREGKQGHGKYFSERSFTKLCPFRAIESTSVH